MNTLRVTVFLILASAPCFAIQVEDRDGVPMAFCGRYHFEVESKDQGKTVKDLAPGRYVDISRYYIQGSVASFAGKITGCGVGVAHDGSTAAGIYSDAFPEGFFWVIQQNYRDCKTAIIYLMQNKGDTAVEVHRFGCSVER